VIRAWSIALAVASRVEIRDALRMQRRDSFDRVPAHLGDTDVPADDWNTSAQSASGEIEEIATNAFIR
jgi:hypothetical protein